MSNFFKTARAVLCAALLFQGTRAIGADIAAADTSAAGGASAPAGDGQTVRDLDACRHAADREMGADAAIDPADDHTANPMVLARREQLRSTYQTLVDQCMGRGGPR